MEDQKEKFNKSILDQPYIDNIIPEPLKGKIGKEAKFKKNEISKILFSKIDNQKRGINTNVTQLDKINEKDISDDISYDSIKQISNIISADDNSFVLKSYIRIQELDIIHLYMVANILSIIDIYYNTCINSNNPERLRLLDKRFERLKNEITSQLRKLGIKENLNDTSFNNFTKILDRDKLIIYKQYCLGHKINLMNIQTINYPSYESINKISCDTDLGDHKHYYNQSIIDKYQIKYDNKYNHIQGRQYSYYQTIGQQLYLDENSTNKSALMLLDDQGIQKKNTDKDPGAKICYDEKGNKTVTPQGFHNNLTHESVKYNMDIFAPKLSKTKPFSYEIGQDNYLNNKINSGYYKKLILDNRDKYNNKGSSNKNRTIEEQLRDNYKIIKNLKTLIIKIKLKTIELKKIIQFEQIVNNSVTLPLVNKIIKYLNLIKIFKNDDILEIPYSFELNRDVTPNIIIIKGSSSYKKEIDYDNLSNDDDDTPRGNKLFNVIQSNKRSSEIAKFAKQFIENILGINKSNTVEKLITLSPTDTEIPIDSDEDKKIQESLVALSNLVSEDKTIFKVIKNDGVPKDEESMSNQCFWISILQWIKLKKFSLNYEEMTVKKLKKIASRLPVPAPPRPSATLYVPAACQAILIISPP